MNQNNYQNTQGYLNAAFAENTFGLSPDTNLQMKLKHMPGYLVLESLEKHVKSERKLMHIILAHVYEVHSRRLYFERGFSSTYEYLRHLGYSETPAYERIRAAELLGKIPEVTEKLQSGSVTLTQLNHVQRLVREKQDLGEYVTLEKTAELITKIENKSGFETKKLLATELNLPVIEAPTLTPQSNNTVRIAFTISEEDYKEIEKAKSHLSHIIPSGELNKIIMKLIKDFNQKIEGKASSSNSATKKKESKNQKETKLQETPEYEIESAYLFDPSRDLSEADIEALGMQANQKTTTQRLVLEAEEFPGTRESHSIAIKRKIFARADHTCEHVDPKTQRKCQSRYQLQIDHIKPLWAGGDNSEENLRCLCAAHNRQIYRHQSGRVH